MALLDSAPRLRAVLEVDDLLAAGLPDDLGRDGGVLDERTADGGHVSVGDEQHAVERDRVARSDLEELDLELRADLDAVLLSAGLDDCVHGSSADVAGGRAAGTTAACETGIGTPTWSRRESGVYGDPSSSVNRGPSLGRPAPPASEQFAPRRIAFAHVQRARGIPASSASAASTSLGPPTPRSGSNRVRIRRPTPDPVSGRTSTSATSGRRSYDDRAGPLCRASAAASGRTSRRSQAAESAGAVLRAPGRHERPSGLQVHAVVGRDHLAGQRRLAEPDVVHVDELMAGRQRAGKARADLGDRPPVHQEQVHQLPFRRHARRQWRRRRPSAGAAREARGRRAAARSPASDRSQAASCSRWAAAGASGRRR